MAEVGAPAAHVAPPRLAIPAVRTAEVAPGRRVLALVSTPDEVESWWRPVEAA